MPKKQTDELQEVTHQDDDPMLLNIQFSLKPEFGITMSKTLGIQRFFAFFMNAKIREMRSILSKELNSAYQSLTVLHANHRFLDLQSLLIPNLGLKGGKLEVNRQGFCMKFKECIFSA